jgi:rubrerythrin
MQEGGYMEKSDSRVEAIKMAMDAEKEAHNYYTKAAQKTTNSKGKDMFHQLAAFELSHYNNLKSLLGSLNEGKGWRQYAGTQFPDSSEHTEGENSSSEEETKDDTLSILSKAIEDEKKASEYYNKLADKTDDPSGKAMFKKLAEEEKLHTKILNDQWYSLNNKGVWIWGD